MPKNKKILSLVLCLCMYPIIFFGLILLTKGYSIIGTTICVVSYCVCIKAGSYFDKAMFTDSG